jgi:hypothetical protein
MLHGSLPHRAPHKLLAQVEHPAGRSRMLVAVYGLALRSPSDAMRAPLTAVVETGCCRAPPPTSHRAASAVIGVPPPHARVEGSEYDQRCQILVIVQCSRRHDRFGARARPSAVSGHHPRTTRMSLGGGECRVGGAAAHYDHHRRRGAESSPPSDRHQQTIDAGRRRPSIATQSAAQAAGAGRAPRRSISHARRCLRARAPLSERCHESPPHRSC